MSESVHQPITFADDLLRTKLVPPRLGTSYVPRGALLAQLDTGVVRKLTLLCTPPGFGKTTLLAEWVAAQPSPVAWLTLDANDNDPVRFWRYVLSACWARDPALGKAALAALRLEQQPAFESLLITWLNELATQSSQYVLVLDDYHFITAPAIHAMLAFVVEHLPETLRIVLLTRGEPALPLPRLRARNELTEFSASDLRFSVAEIGLFVQQTLHVVLAPEALAQLAARTEGWVAGLRLLTLASQRNTEPQIIQQSLLTFTGEHRHVTAYMVSEVLAQQPEPLQDFLLRTCFLSRFNASLCDAVSDRNDSALVLEQLDGGHVFLARLDGAAGQRWYRFHPLFAEAMRQHASRQLGDAVVRELHAKASSWYAGQGMLHDAIEEAIAAEQSERAARLIEQVIEDEWFNEIDTLRRWIERLPRDIVRDYPLLCFAYAYVVLYTWDRYARATALEVERWARLAEAIWQEHGNTHGLGQVAALRATVAFWQNDEPRTFTQARAALELLDEHDARHRSVSLLYCGQEQLLAGDINAAQRSVIEAYTLFEIDQNRHGTLAATQLLGDLCYQSGELEGANAYYQRVLAQAVGGDEMLDDQAYVLCGLSAIAYEQDDLETAEQQVTQAIALATQRGAEAVQVQAGIMRSRVLHAQGQTVEARHELQALATHLRSSALLRDVRCQQAHLALASGDLESARRWHAAVTCEGAPALRVQQEQEMFVSVRLHLAEGHPQAALDVLHGWQADAVTGGRTRSEVAILLLEALAYDALHSPVSAEQALTRALQLAQPAGIRRLLLDEGEPLRALLQTIAPKLSKRLLAAYAAGLLHTHPSYPASAAQVASFALLDPLSAQEARVLRLIVAGRSNTEIAHELVVSTNTIKTHVKHIYHKLNVRTREEAQAAARELRLLRTAN